MKRSEAFSKSEKTHLLRFSLMLLGIGLFSTTLAWASQIVVPAFPSESFAEAWIEGELLLLKTEDGRLYSVPVGSVELESMPAEGSARSPGAPTVSDIIELVLAGVSEPTIKAYVESSRACFEISKEDILSLKRAGASEAFIQYLIFRGRAGSTTNYVTWHGPSVPRNEAAPVIEAREPAACERQEGIPYFPYVIPGFGTYYPIYPSHPIYPGYPPHPTQARGDLSPDLPHGAQAGYYWPQTRSLMKSSEMRPDRPKPGSHSRSTARTGGLWLRWKGGSNPNRGGSPSREVESYSSPNMGGAPPSYRAYGATGSGQPTISTHSSDRGGRTFGARSILGSGSATGSSGGTRSLISKKQ